MPTLALSAAHAEMGNKLINVATTEAHPPLGAAIRKSGRVWHSISDVDQAQVRFPRRYLDHLLKLYDIRLSASV